MKIEKETILRAAFWIGFAIVIVSVLLLLFGKSPTVEQVAIGIGGLLVTDIYRRLQRLEKHSITVESRLSKLEESNIWIRQSLERVEGKLGK